MCSMVSVTSSFLSTSLFLSFLDLVYLDHNMITDLTFVYIYLVNL